LSTVKKDECQKRLEQGWNFLYYLTMEILLAVLAFILLLTGLLGSVVPVIPGPPLGFAGLLLLQWSGYGGFSAAFLWVWAGVTAAVTVTDYVLPAIMTKKFGGSRLAVIGSVLGLIIGIFFFPPIGMILGPFLGALAGELLYSRFPAKRNETNETEVTTNSEAAEANQTRNIKVLKAALGTFLAFIMGTGAKLIAGSLMIFYAVKAVIS
jgi:uncharacterized protein YqgC (DUF456 family)